MRLWEVMFFISCTITIFACGMLVGMIYFYYHLGDITSNIINEEWKVENWSYGDYSRQVTPFLNSTESEKPADIISIIQEIAYNVSIEREYVRYKYDCTDFSRTLVKRLRAINLTAYCVGTYMRTWEDENKTIRKNKNLLHSWVEVVVNKTVYPIEATGGYIIDNETYHRDYVVTERGVCWVSVPFILLV